MEWEPESQGTGLPQMQNQGYRKKSRKRMVEDVSDVEYPAASKPFNSSNAENERYITPKYPFGRPANFQPSVPPPAFLHQGGNGHSMPNLPLFFQNSGHFVPAPLLFRQDPISGDYLPLRHLFSHHPSSGELMAFYHPGVQPQGLPLYVAENETGKSTALPPREYQLPGPSSLGGLLTTHAQVRNLGVNLTSASQTEVSAQGRDKSHNELKNGTELTRMFTRMLMRVPGFRSMSEEDISKVINNFLRHLQAVHNGVLSKEKITTGLADIYSVPGYHGLPNDSKEEIRSIIRVAVLGEWRRYLE